MVIYLPIAIVLAFVVHESGHYLAALYFGHKINFRFGWGILFGKAIIPRGIWNMPDVTLQQQQIIAFAGFALEFAIVPILCFILLDFAVIYWAVATLHLLLYPVYAGSSSDFAWYNKNEK